MIVVDTTAWIDLLKESKQPHAITLRRLIEREPESIVVGDLVLCEVLQGLKSANEAEQVEAGLSEFVKMSMVTPQLAIKAAENYRKLRSLGITVRKTIDTLIATFCIENDFALLHNDRDFDGFERHLNLRVIQGQ